MKKIIASVIAFMILMINVNGQTSAAAQASQIAAKMKHSLMLTDLQKSQIEAATVGIQDIRINLYQLYKTRALNYYLMMVQNKRDTLYNVNDRLVFGLFL